MTDDVDVVVTKQGAIISDESPSLLKAWWMYWKQRYDIAMSIIILILNTSAITYMTAHKIPFTNSELLVILSMFSAVEYFISSVLHCLFWFKPTEDVSIFEFFICMSHTTGFFIFFALVYSISPHLALFTCLPFLLIWFVPALIGPPCRTIYKALCRDVNNLLDWWKHVNQPQPRKSALPV